MGTATGAWNTGRGTENWKRELARGPGTRELEKRPGNGDLDQGTEAGNWKMEHDKREVDTGELERVSWKTGSGSGNLEQGTRETGKQELEQGTGNRSWSTEL